MKNFIALFLLLSPFYSFCQYTGTGSVTHGIATTTATNLYSCTNGRVTNLGTITASDNSVWTVPAPVSYQNSSFPFASDLNNPCTGANYSNTATALAALNGSDIITIDSSGELITAFIFADNYFEMYINGVPVGKDNVTYTQFNSNIIRFKVNRPFTIAMLLVDWEENLGIGTEANGGFFNHIGDGGMVAVFKDAADNIIATTGSSWKAQTFYTAPIMDLTCPAENGTTRLSNNCSTQDSNNGSNYYGLHWALPNNWMDANFNDAAWPQASTYTNATVGVNNKPAYTNFPDIFDNANNDAEFIWSTNLILDNEVIVRYTVPGTTSLQEENNANDKINFYPNPATSEIHLNADLKELKNISIYNSLGEKVLEENQYTSTISLSDLQTGVYCVQVAIRGSLLKQKLIVK